MSFLRSKKVKGIDYYYLVESKREGDKIKQNLLHYFGKNKPGVKEIESIKKQQKVSTTIKKVEERPLSEFANINDISFERAYSGFRNTSFSPDDRAIQFQNQYVIEIDNFATNLMSLAETTEQKEKAILEIERYKEGYLKRQNSILDARSRTASTMITGGANFPTKRNQKALDRETKLTNELLEWREKAKKKSKSNVIGAFTGNLSIRELDIMKKNIDHAIEVKLKIQNNDPQFRGFNINVGSNSLQGKLLRNLKNGNVELVEESLKYIEEKEKVLKKPVFSKRNKIFKELQEAKVKPIEAKKTGIKTVKKYKGAKIVNNFDASRIQLEFDDIPNQAIRNNLKSNGWHFSRNNEVWQRKNTSNAIFDSKNLLDRYFDE